ncbi:hypothetical protein JVU11DRAFT_9647 [Chiua virens]|nr:hypothetical protein JVU11DRAFT_9647 [Chiua virens]
MSNSSWIPNESPQTLFSERCWLHGTIVSTFAYGVAATLYFMSFHLLVRAKKRMAFKFKTRLFLLLYITITFVLSTIFMISLAASTQMAFIDNRNYPGGPNAFEDHVFSIPVGQAGNVAFALSYSLSDTLLVSHAFKLGDMVSLAGSPPSQVWRFKVIYQSCRFPTWIVMLLPNLLFVGSGAMGILLLIQLSATANPFVTTGTTVNYILPYFSLVLALNVILTIAIVLRLLHFRYRITSVMGPKYGSQYTSIAMMLIESAALYSIVSIAFVVLFAVGNAVSQVFLQSLIQFQTIAMLLIVFRVAQGKGWTKETATRATSGGGPAKNSELSKMHFASPDTTVSFSQRSAGETLRSGEPQEPIDHNISGDDSFR